MKTPDPKLFPSMLLARKRMHLMSFALMAAILCLPAVAHASHHLQITPATCMPDDSDWVTPTEFAFNSDGSLAFASGKTGIVTLRCNITNVQDSGANPASWTNSEIYYQDDSIVAFDHVIVYLYQINNTTGASAVETLLNSDSSDPAPAWTFSSHTLTTTFDFATNHYFIEIHLHRVSTTANEKLLLVAI